MATGTVENIVIFWYDNGIVSVGSIFLVFSERCDYLAEIRLSEISSRDTFDSLPLDTSSIIASIS